LRRVNQRIKAIVARILHHVLRGVIGNYSDVVDLSLKTLLYHHVVDDHITRGMQDVRSVRRSSPSATKLVRCRSTVLVVAAAAQAKPVVKIYTNH